MQTETIAIADLVAPARNVRVHPELQITELGRAIVKFGQTRPVVIDEDNVILAGNGLVEACRRLGRDKVIVYRMTDLSSADKTKLMLSDNRIYSLGLDDHGAILDAIRGFGELDFDIPGFDAETLQALTLDISSVTELSLDNYGTLPESAIVGANARTIERGNTSEWAEDAAVAAPGGPGAAVDDEDDDGAGFKREETGIDGVTCPSCGHSFAP